MRPRDLHAVMDVLDHLRLTQCRQVVAHRDALLELHEARMFELLAQLRLAEQENLDELLGLGLEIRDQAHLLQGRERQVLRLVDDEDDVLVLSEHVDQELVDRVEDRDAMHLRHIQPELPRDAVEQLDTGEPRIGDQRRDRVFVELAQQTPTERGLAGPDLAGEDREALPRRDRVEQLGQSLVVPLTREVEPRVRRVVEGRPIEAEE